MNPQLPCRGESCEIDRYIILVCKLLWSTIEHISHITAWFLYLMYHVNLCYIYTYICTILRWQIQRIAYVMRPAAGTALADSRERGELQWIAVKRRRDVGQIWAFSEVPPFSILLIFPCRQCRGFHQGQYPPALEKWDAQPDRFAQLSYALAIQDIKLMENPG